MKNDIFIKGTKYSIGDILIYDGFESEEFHRQIIGITDYNIYVNVIDDINFNKTAYLERVMSYKELESGNWTVKTNEKQELFNVDIRNRHYLVPQEVKQHIEYIRGEIEDLQETLTKIEMTREIFINDLISFLYTKLKTELFLEEDLEWVKSNLKRPST